MEYIIIFLVTYVLLMGLRIETLKGQIDELQDMIRNERFDISFELPEESAKKMAKIFAEEMKKQE